MVPEGKGSRFMRETSSKYAKQKKKVCGYVRQLILSRSLMEFENIAWNPLHHPRPAVVMHPMCLDDGAGEKKEEDALAGDADAVVALPSFVVVFFPWHSVVKEEAPRA